jgi:hypothetical protein
VHREAAPQPGDEVLTAVVALPAQVYKQ